MVLDVRRALRAGYDDLASRAGLAVFSVLLVFNLVYGAVVASFRQQLFEFLRRRGPDQFPVVFVDPPPVWDALLGDLPLPLLAGLALVGVLTAEAIRFWAIRLFADLSIAPIPDLRDRLPVLLGVGGGFALALFGLRQVLPLLWVNQGLETVELVSRTAGAVALGLVGVTVYLRQEIALTDAGTRETVRCSVRRFLAEPVPSLGLLALLGLLGVLTGIPVALTVYVGSLGTGGGGQIVPVAELVETVLGTVLSTFSIAAVTDAYVQIRGGRFR